MSVEPRDVGRWIRMAVTDEITPVRVPVIQAKQTGDTCPRSWDWVERTIWTDRMLDALEQGVKGGCWFSLIDKVIRPGTLYAAWGLVKEGEQGQCRLRPSEHKSL